MYIGSPPGAVRENWKDAEKISMAPAQGRRAHIEKGTRSFGALDDMKEKTPSEGVSNSARRKGT